MPDQTERNRARKFAKLARKCAASLNCCECDAPEDDMTVQLAVYLGEVVFKNYELKITNKELLDLVEEALILIEGRPEHACERFEAKTKEVIAKAKGE